jgi:DNA-binding NarL/FixJ family response regulator
MREPYARFVVERRILVPNDSTKGRIEFGLFSSEVCIDDLKFSYIIHLALFAMSTEAFYLSHGPGADAVNMAPDRLLVVDANDLRRAGVASLLTLWAQAHDLVVTEVSLSALLAELDGFKNSRIVVVSVGSDSVSAPSLQKLLRLMHALSADLPAIILSDREDPSEIVLAYNASCRGFVPTTMEPKLALSAMSFILGGGSFFPPSALSLVKVDAFDEPNRDGNPPPPSRGNSPESDSAEPSFTSGSCSDGLARENAGTSRSPEDRIDGRPDHGLQSPMAATEAIPLLDDHLTCRQRQVLVHLRRGCPNKIIARKLGVTEGTVKVHVRQVMRKLGAANRTQAAVLCGAEAMEISATTDSEPLRYVAHSARNADSPVPLGNGKNERI